VNRRWRARTPGHAAAAVLLAALALPVPGSGTSQQLDIPAQAPAPRTAVTADLAASMPDPAVIAQGVSSGNPAHLFKDPSWDFATMRQTFNAVDLLPGDQAMVDAARQAGLAVVLEFDYKADFFAGKDISAKVAAVADQITSHPGTVAAVHVADRLNQNYSAAQGLRYLAATGGVLHRLAPGVPVLVNASDWQLTCGLAGQSSCAGHGPRFQYETDATLQAFRRSGYLDGISIADNLKNENAAAQVAAWQRARARWPAPFILWATCSQLSFGQASYPGTPAADAATRAYMLVPVGLGADAVALWAWHQKYQGAVDTFLDKDGGSNAMWASMTAAAQRIAAAGAAGAKGRAALAVVPAGAPSVPGSAATVAVVLILGAAIVAGLGFVVRRAPLRSRG
jgi:hypothetical protein